MWWKWRSCLQVVCSIYHALYFHDHMVSQDFIMYHEPSGFIEAYCQKSTTMCKEFLIFPIFALLHVCEVDQASFFYNLPNTCWRDTKKHFRFSSLSSLQLIQLATARQEQKHVSALSFRALSSNISAVWILSSAWKWTFIYPCDNWSLQRALSNPWNNLQMHCALNGRMGIRK